MIEGSENPIRVLLYGHCQTSYHLYFSHLNHTNNFKVKFVYFYSQTDIDEFYNTDLVIIDRDIKNALKLVRFLKKMEIPCFYFIDDNFAKLSQEKINFRAYKKEKWARMLKDINGVLTSTFALQDFFIKNNLHQQVYLFPPALNTQFLPTSSKNSTMKKQLNIGVVGSGFRSTSLFNSIMPVLKQIHQQIPVKFFIRQELCTESINDYPFEIEVFKTFNKFEEYVHFLQKNIDIIIHPYGGSSQHIPYKTNAVFLSALYGNNNIIVSEEPAFGNISENQGIIKIGLSNDKSDNFELAPLENAILALADEQTSKLYKTRFYEYCLQEFSPNKQQDLFELIKESPQKPPLLCRKKALQKALGKPFSVILKMIIKKLLSSLN